MSVSFCLSHLSLVLVNKLVIEPHLSDIDKLIVYYTLIALYLIPCFHHALLNQIVLHHFITLLIRNSSSFRFMLWFDNNIRSIALSLHRQLQSSVHLQTMYNRMQESMPHLQFLPACLLFQVE